MELATKKTLADTIEWVKVSGVAWQRRRLLLQPLSRAGEGQGEGVDQREPPGLLPQASARRSRRTTLVYEDPANPQRFHTRRDDRGRAVRDPRRSRSAARARTATRSSCATCRSGEREFTPVIPTIGDDTLRRRRQRRRQAARRDQPQARRTGASCWSIRRSRREANWKTVLPERPEPLESVEHGRRQAVRDLPEGRRRRAPTSTASTASSRTRSRCPGLGTRRRLRRPARRHVRVLHVQLAQRAADDLPLRHRDAARARVFRAAEGAGLRPDALRDEAGLLHEQGRHEGADVPRPQEGPEARRQQPDAALRLRRLQHRR